MLEALTARRIAAALSKPPKKELSLSDGGGLFLRVQPSGVASWRLEFGPKGHRRKLTLGSPQDHSLDAARVWAKKQRAMFADGVDPKAVRAAVHNAAERMMGELLDAYCADLDAKAQPSAYEVRNVFKNHAPAWLRKMPAVAVSRDDIVRALRESLKKKAARQSGKLRSYMSAAFARALAADDGLADCHESLAGFGLKSNPVLSTKAIGKAGRRQNPLTHAELVEFWRRLLAAPIERRRDLLMLCCMLGGQRLRQTAAATLKPDPHGNPGVLILDGKGVREEPFLHWVPLSDEAAAIAKRVPMALAPTQAKVAGNDAGRVFAAIAAEMVAAGLMSAGHEAGDLRATCETLLAEFKVPPEHRKRLQSHGLGGVVDAHYNAYEFADEKREALAVWDDILHGRIRKGPKGVILRASTRAPERAAGAKVVPLRRRG